MARSSEIERDLQTLAAELRRLEAEYNMYFGGRLPRPPVETRARVEALLKRLDRAPFEQVAQRFRMQTLQSRFATFVELWDRGMRVREEGRPDRGRARRAEDRPRAADRTHGDRIVHDASFEDPIRQMDRLEQLYDALIQARREHGERMVPFHRFAALVRDQVTEMRREGAEEVAFRVSVRDGKVRLTASATKEVGK